MEKKTFMLMDEKSIGYNADLITVLEIDNEKYAIYSIDNTNGTSNVYASQLKKDQTGHDILASVEEEKKSQIFKIVEELLTAK